MVALGCALLGALVGAVAPGAAYRLSVPYGAPAAAGCRACGRPLPGGLAGWVRVPARCPACGARYGLGTWRGALVGAAVFGGLGWALGPITGLPAFLLVAGLGVPLAWIDLACLRLPDPLVGAAFAGAVGLLSVASIVDGSWAPLVRGVLAAAALAAGYLVLALLPGANLGFGDVKLAGVLGLLLGWLGWRAVLLGAVLPHMINGPIAVALLVRGRARRDTQLPLGPALLAGALLAVLVTPSPQDAGTLWD
jgi:leader peptidase (prepilin peptidase)/N-methyltransferase